MGFASLRQVSDRIAFSFLSIYAKGFGVAVHRWLRIPFLHPQPLLRRRFCTAVCRGRRLCRPDVSGWHRTAVKCGDTATVASQTYFFCCARKSRQKDALGRVLYCALPRASFWPLRGLNALFGRKTVTFPIAVGSDVSYRSVGADVHPQGVGRIRSAPSSLTAALAIGPYKHLQ